MREARTNLITFSPASERASRIRPGRNVFCSLQSGWKSILVQTFEQPAFVERYETLPSPDVLLVLVLKGEYNLGSLSSGRWQRAVYRPGVVGLTAPMTTNRLRWHNKSGDNSRVLRTYIPCKFFEEIAEELRRPGTNPGISIEDCLAVSDPVVSSLLQALGSGAEAGLPDLYAETAVRYLATHLLLRTNAWSDRTSEQNRGIDISDRRLSRTLEFMVAHFAESLTIDQLAKEAGISP